MGDALVKLDLTREECERLVEAVRLARDMEGPKTEGRFRALQDKVYSAVAEVWWQDFVIYVEAIKRYHPSKRVDIACDEIILESREENRKTPPPVAVAKKPRRK